MVLFTHFLRYSVISLGDGPESSGDGWRLIVERRVSAQNFMNKFPTVSEILRSRETTWGRTYKGRILNFGPDFPNIGLSPTPKFYIFGLRYRLVATLRPYIHKLTRQGAPNCQNRQKSPIGGLFGGL